MNQRHQDPLLTSSHVRLPSQRPRRSPMTRRYDFWSNGLGLALTILYLTLAAVGGWWCVRLAAVVRHATGIDLTPAMLEHARMLADQKGLANVSWQQGDVLPLPYPDASFTIVTARFTFHHFPDPLGVLKEMRRVCTPMAALLW